MTFLSNGTARFKKVNNCLNNNIYCYLNTSGGQNYNLYLNVVYFFNTSVEQTTVAAYDSCFPTLVPNTHCSIIIVKLAAMLYFIIILKRSN
jgi:hypothetical protein